MRYAYDERNHLTDTTDGESDTPTYGYDREGNRASVQEPKGEMSRFDYDELGKLIRVTQPRPDPDQPSPVTSYEYDENRNRVRQTDGNGHVVSMTYDRLDRMTRMAQDPDGLNLVTQHEYDESGNERSLMDAKGQTVTSTYDPLDRLKTKAYAFAPADTVRPWRHTTSIAYTYDANNNLKQVDERVASGNDPPSTTLTTLRDYDDLDRLQSETNPLPDGGNRTASFTYHRNGTRETLT